MKRWLFLACLLATSVAYALSFPLNHDAAWWLHVAGEMMDGAGLYTDIIEINPPLIGYLSMIPVLMSTWLGLSIEVAFEILVTLVALSVTVWSIRELARSDSSSLPMVFGAGLVLSFFAIPGGDFGQREHLMFILTVPYGIVLWTRIVGGQMRRGQVLVAGCLAGIGFGLKPHFLLILLCLETWYALRSEGWSWKELLRPELLAVVAVGGAYAGFVLLRYPEYFSLLHDVGPLYWSFNNRPIPLLIVSPHLVPLGIAALVALLVRGRAGELVRILVVFGGSAFAIMVLQGKGWTYHEYPVFASVLPAGILIGYEAANRRARSVPPDHRPALDASALGVAILMVAWISTLQQLECREQTEARIARWMPQLEELSTGSSVLMLSDLFEDAFPLVTVAGVDWASPFAHIWWIKPLYAGQSPAISGAASPGPEERAVERRFVQLVGQHVRDEKPEYVFVNRGRRAEFGGRPFPYIAYLNRSSEFREVWRSYGLRGSRGDFTIWKRTAER